MAADTFLLQTTAQTNSILNTSVVSLFMCFFLPPSLSIFFSYCLSSTISINVLAEVLSSVLGKDKDFSLPSPVKIFEAHQIVGR